MENARKIISEKSDSLQKLAGALIERESLSAKDIHEIIKI
jgi:ATP-dependent Zn protease